MFSNFKKVIGLGLLILSTSTISFAESMNQEEHDVRNNLVTSSPQYVEEYIDVNTKMHVGMNVVDRGDPDLFFVESMLAHHIGAVEMARVQLEYGKNPEMRKLAEEIIKSQDIEIEQMKNWLKNRGVEIKEESVEETFRSIHNHH